MSKLRSIWSKFILIIASMYFLIFVISNQAALRYHLQERASCVPIGPVLKKQVFLWTMGLRKRCSYWSRIVWFLVFVISNMGVFRYHLQGKTELSSYWSSVKKTVFQLASGLWKRYSYWSRIVLFLAFVISNQGVLRYHLQGKTELCTYWLWC